MIDKIEVGEYVRTEIGTIGKVRNITYAGSGTRYYGEELERNYYTIDYNDGNTYGRFDDYGITKHSPNIIDLIEVGDYVNGYKVRGKTNEKVVVDYYCYSQELCDGQWLSFQKDLIKSIVTKEQFKEMEYRV